MKHSAPISVARSFVELCARSNFSFLQGASHPEEMVEESIRLGYDGIAITDLNGLYGVVRAFQTATAPELFTASPNPKKGFISVFGTELTLADQGHSVTLIPLTQKGYFNLCRILTLGKRNAQKGYSKVTSAEIIEHGEDLLLFAHPQNFLAFQKAFADRIYIPIHRDLTWESILLGQEAFRLEKEQGAKLFVTQRPFMHTAERKVVFDTLTCILHHTTLTEAKDILIQNAERHLHTLPELSALWQDRIDLIEVTLEIARRIQFSLSEIRYRYPQAALEAGETTSDRLRSLSLKGLAWRYPEGPPESVVQMLSHELEIIRKLEYEDYFLTLEEICQFARAQGILFQGRGSAANSVVCFCIGITSVDPTKIDLLFERFISLERAEPPDIDIDFEHERREEVIQHIYQKYDAEHAAMVCTVIRYKTRMAIRESAKVLGIPLKTVNAMIKFIGRDGFRRLREECMHERFGIDEHRWRLFLAVGQSLQGFPRHLGIHTGGFLISHNPITEIVPVEKASMNGRYVIQWNKDDVNFLRLMKIDVLSLGMLTAIQKSLLLLRKHKNIHWNLAQIPPEDPLTYEKIQEADTVGVFQIESRAQMQTLPRLKPKCFYDLVVEVALVRPGPLQGGMVHPYLQRRAGLEKVRYPHPSLEPVLKKTMGVPIFQEQVMKIAVAAAGFSPGEANELRRVMSLAWKKKGTMEGVRTRIFQGLKENGISDKDCEQIYKTIEGFANYGFPESHAASFALLTYASAYLHIRHPDVFTCALLNSQPMGFYSPRNLIADAQRHQVKMRPLDVQHSNYDYSLEPSPQAELLDLRVGFRSVHGIPTKLLREIENLRPFFDVSDFAKRTGFSRPHLLKLAAAGAFQCFSDQPRKILWEIESMSLDQNSFLWGLPRENFQEKNSELPFESQWEEMQREYAHKGFSLHLHPMSILRSTLDQRNEALLQKQQVPFSDGKKVRVAGDGQKIRIAGMISLTQRPPTAKGMCFITLEDEFGFINIVIPPDVYQKDRLAIYGSSLLEIWGTVERRNSVINVKAKRVFPLLTEVAEALIPSATMHTSIS